MTSTKSQLLAGMREYLRGLDQKVKALETERSGVEAAIAVLDGGAVKPPAQPKRRMQRRRRRSPEHWDNRILDFLRAHPDQAFEPVEVAQGVDGPVSTIRPRVEALTAEGKVTQVDLTVRGKPIIKHKPITVRPGIEVVA